MREKDKRTEIYDRGERRNEVVEERKESEVEMTWELDRVAMNELPNSG